MHDCRWLPRHCLDIVCPWLMLQVCISPCAERHWQDKGVLVSLSRGSWSGQTPLDMRMTPRLTQDNAQHHSLRWDCCWLRSHGQSHGKHCHSSRRANPYALNFVRKLPWVVLIMHGILCLLRWQLSSSKYDDNGKPHAKLHAHLTNWSKLVR